MSPKPFKRGRVYHYEFWLGGTRYAKSTRETTLAKAEVVVADAWEGAKRQQRGESPEPTLAGLVEQWVARNTLPLSPAYVGSVESWGRLHLGQLADLRISTITKALVETERNAYLAQHAPSSAYQWLVYLRMVFRWALAEKMIREVPWVVKVKKPKKVPRRTLAVSRTLEWLDAVREFAAREPAIYLAIRLMAGFGLRISEALNARWEWFEPERSAYTPGLTKGGEAWRRPVPAEIVAELVPLAKPFGLIVPAADGRLLTHGRIQRVMDKACKRVGHVRITPHRLRGTYATLLAEEGTPLPDIQRALGHKDPRTTLGYIEADLGRVAKAQARIHTRFISTSHKIPTSPP
jgi:integrase/recombinase XerC